MKICIKCLVDKELEDYPKKAKAKDGRTNTCKLCVNAYSKQHYENNKEAYIKKARKWDSNQRVKFNEYLATQSCLDCGENDPVVLEFDHRGDKLFNVSEKVGVIPLTKLMLEIDKCDVLCANCHRRRTAKQFNWTKYTP